MAVVAGLSVAGLSIDSVRWVIDEPLPAQSQQHRTEGRYGFTSTQGEYPVVASGQFQGAKWRLTVAIVDESSVNLSLTIESNDGAPDVEEFVHIERASDAELMPKRVQLPELFGGVDVLFGGVVPDVAKVDVSPSDGSEMVIPAHRFLQHREQTFHTDFFIAFAPLSVMGGFVHARDTLGVDVQMHPYGKNTLAPHVVASGRVGDTSWGVEFAPTQKDRFCIVFSGRDSQCMTRNELEAAGPIHLFRFDHDDVLGLVAIISEEVYNAQLTIGDGVPIVMHWFQPPNEDRADWPIRMVAVGLEPGTDGSIAATFADPEKKVEEEF